MEGRGTLHYEGWLRLARGIRRDDQDQQMLMSSSHRRKYGTRELEGLVTCFEKSQQVDQAESTEKKSKRSTLRTE